jgi:hypothetical protein
MARTAAWQRKEGKDPKGGLNRKGIASYRAANPGSKLSMAVTTKKYMLGQAHAYQITLQEISNLLKPKEQKDEQGNIIDFGTNSK